MSNVVFNIMDIQKMLPHRYPFLFVDSVIECEKGVRAVGVKNVSMNEWFFAGHFPNEPVMPGVLIIEALAQLSGIVMLSTKYGQEGFNSSNSMYFVKIEEAIFKKKVVPGDMLIMYSKNIRSKIGMFVFECEAYVENELAASAKIIATVG